MLIEYLYNIMKSTKTDFAFPRELIPHSFVSSEIHNQGLNDLNGTKNILLKSSIVSSLSLQKKIKFWSNVLFVLSECIS